jgi:short-subunit dehydrogenase
MMEYRSMMNNNELKDRYGPTALVTGASSGIGQSFAELLAATGLNLVLVARRVDRLEVLAARLQQQHGIEVQVCQLDLGQASAVPELLAATAEMDIGLVISNAGFGFKGDHAAADADMLARMLMVNCHTPMLLTHGFIPRLRARGKGGIILTSSVEGLLGCPYSSAYSASKGFVKNLGEGLWAELKPDGIDVLTLCPGATDTEAPASQGIDPKTLQHMMSPDDVARLTLEQIQQGPVFISSEHYQKSFDMLLSLPRPQALMAMAASMKPKT